MTESSGHNSEYNWWFRKRPDLIEKYCTHGTGWNPGETSYIIKHYEERQNGWRDDAKKWFALDNPISLERGSNMRPTSSTHCKAASHSSSTAMSRTPG